MKIIKYTLTPEGKVPEYVIDGGYLPANNNGISPQDLDLIGVTKNSAPENSFANEAALLTYIQDKNFTFIDSISDQVIPQATVASSIWSKLGS